MSHFWPEQRAIARFYTNSVTAGVTESICCFLNRHPRRVTCEPLFSSSTMCDKMLLSVSLSQCLAQSERSDVFFSPSLLSQPLFEGFTTTDDACDLPAHSLSFPQIAIVPLLDLHPLSTPNPTSQPARLPLKLSRIKTHELRDICAQYAPAPTAL